MNHPLDHAAEIDRSAPGLAGCLWSRWHATPLYMRICAAVVCGLLVGVLLGPQASSFGTLGKVLIRILNALAPPLILVAVVQALMRADIGGRAGFRMVRLLLLNTLVAISFGLLVANVVQPGRWSELAPPQPEEKAAATLDPLAKFLESVPKSLLGPLGDSGNVLSVIMIAIAFGIAMRDLRRVPLATVEDLVDVTFRSLVRVLSWIIEIIPLAVFGVVAGIVGVKGFKPFIGLGAFVLAVLLALALQTTYYLVRIRLGSWVRPATLLRETRDALVMAFSTGSSTATMPVTYQCLRERVGLRESSASLGALVGANFNNDGTALYEAMSALFVMQTLGQHLSLGQQLMVVVTSVVASVGAAGIPEAGLVTMTLVLQAVGLQEDLIPHYITLLLTVDWFLDRCRTTVNVLGDMNVSCLLDGPVPEARAEVVIVPPAPVASDLLEASPCEV